MRMRVALQLGRVSNLPTVWTNALAGTVLAGGTSWSVTSLLVVLGLSLLYTAGMYLNDAFDREIDARERPERPIPAGRVGADTVFAAGFGLMLAGFALILGAAHATAPAAGWPPMLAALALGGAILFYDWSHKANPLSPLFMGLCRVLAYLTAGFAAAAAPAPGLFVAAMVSLSYLIGLTYAAKQERFARLGSRWPLVLLSAPLLYGLALGRGGVAAALLLLALAVWMLVALYHLKRRAPGDVARAIAWLIAGIALVDALFLAGAGAGAEAVVAALCCLLTLVLQRWVSGT